MRSVVTLVVILAVLFAAPSAFADVSAPAILPGIAIGPVRLGMTESDGRVAASAFERATGCRIDIMNAGGRVAAAGSRFGGCLELAVPDGPVPLVRVGGQMVPLATGIGGSPAALVQAFGKPAMFTLAPGIAALVWTNGLVAQVALADGGAVITYLAIVPAGTNTPPYPLLYQGPQQVRVILLQAKPS